MSKIKYPRLCCACGNKIEKHPKTAVACFKCGADWDSFIGNFGGQLIDKKEVDKIALKNIK